MPVFSPHGNTKNVFYSTYWPETWWHLSSPPQIEFLLLPYLYYHQAKWITNHMRTTKIIIQMISSHIYLFRQFCQDHLPTYINQGQFKNASLGWWTKKIYITVSCDHLCYQFFFGQLIMISFLYIINTCTHLSYRNKCPVENINR